MSSNVAQGGHDIDDILTKMLKARIVPGGIDLKKIDSFSFKIKLARAIGLLRKPVYDSLNNILRIRNIFAHDYSKKNFENEKFSCYIDSIFQLNKEILEAVKNVSEKALSKGYKKEELAAILEDKTHRMMLAITCTAAGLSGALPHVEKLKEPQ